MKLFRKVVDERQEQELKRIESGAYYVFLFGLGISILVQLIMFDFDITHIAGELIVLFMGVAWAMIGYIRRGIWDYYTKPGIKSYLICSTIVGLVYGILGYFYSGISFSDFLPTFALRFLWFFVIMFLMLSLLGTIIKMRAEKLQKENEDDNR
jgi:hypothetical protein